MGRLQNHGKRNLPGWQRLSQRERGRLAARQAVQGYEQVVLELDDVRRALNIVSLRFEALLEFLLSTGHTHPVPGGIVLIGQNVVHPPVPLALDAYNDVIAHVRNRWLAQLEAEEDAKERGDTSAGNPALALAGGPTGPPPPPAEEQAA